MESMQTVQEFLGWCTVLSIGLLIFSSVMLMRAGDSIKKLHARMFRLAEEDVARAHFQYISQLKIVILVFHLVPYLALCIME